MGRGGDPAHLLQKASRLTVAVHGRNCKAKLACETLHERVSLLQALL